MKKILLDKNWEFLESDLVNKLMLNVMGGWKKIRLPHDYGVEKERSPNTQSGVNEGYTQAAGLYYRKEFTVSANAAGKRFWLEFEAVAGLTQVWVNGELAAKNHNPFCGFWADVSRHIKPGSTNEIRVFTDNRHKPNCRWYTGTGIYGHVWLHVGEAVALKPNAARIVTKNLSGNKALVAIAAGVVNESGSEQTVQLTCRILDTENKEIACNTRQVVIDGKEKTVGAELELSGITPWSFDTPYLYTVRIEIKTNNGITDTAECRTGLRMITVDAENGFTLNGTSVKLRGGCIHHDLGMLGAAGHDSAIRRKIRLLKESGYNALRFAHNPYLPGYFDACDELGIVVIAEAFDEWVLARSSFGISQYFEAEWEAVLESMISREYNHPSIIVWSTGNEVEERDGSADGYAWSARLADKVRGLDASRPVSVTACSLPEEYGKRPANGATGNQALNMAYDNFESGVDLWGDKTAAFFAPVDVAGYNYKSVRYAHDGKKFPKRVIYGSESYPRGAYASWQATLENKHVIGDFVWTAMDYLGEQGLGRFSIGEGMFPPSPAWPWLTAHSGDLDLAGDKRPQSYYRDALWRRNSAPRLFVLPPELTGKPLLRMSWTWDPVERNYTFPNGEGQPIEAHIYTCADEVELLQNGKSLGRKKSEEYKAVFVMRYEPGELTAVAYQNGSETGRDVLRTAGRTARIELTAERNAIQGDGADLCFVTLRALDENGEPVFLENGEVSVTLQGGGALAALGSADPKPDRLKPFGETSCPMYQGAALAVIRSEEGVKGCLFTAAMNGLSASLGIGFTPVEAPPEDIVAEIKSGGPLDLPLGDLLRDEKNAAVLKQYLPELMGNPMLNHMQSMSLKKLAGSAGPDMLPPDKLRAIEEALQNSEK